MTRLEGKSALITGAAQGIGRGFAQAHVREGARVAIADINLDAARDGAAQSGLAAYAIRLDVSDQASIDAAIAAVIGQPGKLDILINNAALFGAAKMGTSRGPAMAHWQHVDSMFARLEGKAPGQKKAEVAARVPAGRFATPADLTGMVVFLASSEADYVGSQCQASMAGHG